MRGGLLGESERKNIYQMASDNVEVTYHKLHHFLTEATWSAEEINGLAKSENPAGSPTIGDEQM